ncbi:MAG: beta-ketoacyl-ACP synthase II [Candidatus Mcinerneyibacterium aminivorans]|uniref:3-oxoacyl-[acyl-carrier-protein] synthase 2 n=1 Tax=Candidatus Mcinerneyibacterium aminivorans TaxID=2703815 RepID=A0A5D0MK31_9BACT|nr:MAG: beta-ketoacyl-ACP synthase II [Candidatus Mcinerneyibacterium aminivorans]
MSKRVVITGMGALSPVGKEIDEIWNSLMNGESGVQKIDRFDVSEYSSKIAGLVKDYNSEDYISRKEQRRMDKFIQYGIIAAMKALEHSGLEITDDIARDVAIIVSSGIGGMETLSKQHSRLIKRGPKRVSPFFIPKMISNILSGYISIRTGAKGPNMSVITACATGTHSIGEGFNKIKNGTTKAAIVGGSETPVVPLGLAGFCAMRALSTRNDEPEKASRPFDKNRDGFVMAEGAAVLVLEELERAKRRGADIYAEVIGYGASADAYHITAPQENGEGAAIGMQKAIDDAGIEPEQIDYINAHGTSTPLNDVTETKAIKTVFGDHAKKLYINSTKSMTGHLLGATGAFETLVTALSLKKGKMHQTINIENQDPECDLNYLADGPVEDDIQYAMTNSFGFGGQNGILVLKKYNE